MALKNRLPERMFTALLPAGEQYLIGLRALSVGGVHALAWGTGGVGQVALQVTRETGGRWCRMERRRQVSHGAGRHQAVDEPQRQQDDERDAG